MSPKIERSETLNMVSKIHPAATLALFCKVVDNYGDVGICWRLSRQLFDEHGIAVTLWLDDLRALQRIWPAAAVGIEIQVLDGVTVRYWHADAGSFLPEDIADTVIEFFGCEIPEAYVAAMAQRDTAPLWLNLEGLSAEAWVEGCHLLPSPHPRLPLTKYFFFPGFTASTGGLLQERALHERRRMFQSSPAASAKFLAGLGVTALEADARKISLFCYPHAPVARLFATWQDQAQAITCLVPEGVAVDAVQAYLEMPAQPGAVRTRGALTVRVLPFVPQLDYDKLLWACDINFVRGEDSFVRAQWAGKPFIWHIYPQDKNLHHVKLRAFLDRYAVGMPGLTEASLAWNGALSAGTLHAESPVDWASRWSLFQADLPQMTQRATEWIQQMQANGDMTSNMLKFAASVVSKISKNPL